MRALVVVVAAALAAILPARAGAADVVILVDPDVPQYAETAKAIRARLDDAATVALSGDDPVAAARRHSPRVIVAVGQKALTLVAGRVTDVPIVYATVLFPDKHGLTAENITGVPLEIPAAAQLAKFQLVAPRVKRLGVIYSKDSGAIVEEGTRAAKSLGLTIVAKAVTSSREVADALDEMDDRIDALWLVPDAKIVNKDVFAYLLRATLDEGIPLFGFLEGFTQAGALASIAPDYADIGAKAADLAKKVLAAPATLPTKVYSNGALSVNLKTAQRLGLEIDKSVEKGAARVYK
jgi:putative ABC transport system substrate-binding protein